MRALELLGGHLHGYGGERQEEPDYPHDRAQHLPGVLVVIHDDHQNGDDAVVDDQDHGPHPPPDAHGDEVNDLGAQQDSQAEGDDEAEHPNPAMLALGQQQILQHEQRPKKAMGQDNAESADEFGDQAQPGRECQLQFSAPVGHPSRDLAAEPVWLLSGAILL